MVVSNKKTQQIFAIIYARKSTDAKLEQEVNSISVQCASARSYIESHKHLGWVARKEVLIDNNVSGSTMKRDGIDRLTRLILEGKVQVVVVNRLDRISRSLSQFLNLMAFFEEHGVALVSVTQSINTGTPAGRLMLSVIMGFAEYEREIICERVTERMHAARKLGRFIGGLPPLGYNIVPEGGALEVDELEAILVHKIFMLYLELHSVKAVALDLNGQGITNKKWITRAGTVSGGKPFTPASVHKLITNPVYVGKVTLKGETYEGNHEAIIEQDLFDQVQSMLAENSVQKGNRQRNAHNALLKGLLICSACDAPFVHTYTKKKTRLYRYYTCSNKRLNGAHVCPSNALPAGEIEKLVAEQLFAVGSDPKLQDEVYHQLTGAVKERREAAKDAHKAAERQLTRIHRELASSREFNASEALVCHLEEKRKEAEKILQDTEADGVEVIPSKEDVIAKLRDMQGLWPSFNAGEKHAFIKALVRRVEYDAVEGNLTLHFNDEAFVPRVGQGGAI